MPATDESTPKQDPSRSRDEVALEMMKFIAVTTGYGKGSSGAGYGSKGTPRTPEEYAEALIELFQKCRGAIAKE